MAYKEMEKIYDRTRLEIFVMAVGHLLDVGFNNVKEITDDQIATISDQGWATAGFLQKLVTTSKEIANACETPVELIQFCAAENVFDTEFYANKHKISDMRIREIAEHAVSYIWDEDMFNYFNDYVDLTPEEKEYFGIIDDEDKDENDDYDNY